MQVGFLSTLITRGTVTFGLPNNTLRKNRLAALILLVSFKRKSSVCPVESTARYRYIHLPQTLMQVSSTRQESLVFLMIWSAAPVKF